MARLLRSISVRLALGYAGLFIVSSLLLVGFLWWRTAGYLDREIDAVIVADTRAVGDRLQDFGLSGATETINSRIGETADEHAIFLLTDPALAPIAGNLNAWPAEVGSSTGWYQVQLVQDDRLHATRILHVVLSGDFHLLVGRDVQDRAAIQALILEGLYWAAGTALLLAAAGGMLVRRAVLRRVDAINRTTSAIVQGDLTQRLPTHDSPDEFDQLTRTINGMLQQIQLLVDGIRNTSNAVAHELRTPLAELRSRIEELLRTRPPAALTFDALQEAVVDIDHLIGIFNALLRLAEIDSGARRSGFRIVELMDVVTEVAELYNPVAEEKGTPLAVKAPPGLAVSGDPFLLAQAVGNLVDNAVKYVAVGGTVSLTLARRPDGQIEITVADNGPGIREIEKPRVTERFYRGDASRGTPGIGLGLSVVAAVAHLHGGALSLTDNRPGLSASLILPVAEQKAPVPSTSQKGQPRRTAGDAAVLPSQSPPPGHS
jgi:signal transduction histidine kinase